VRTSSKTKACIVFINLQFINWFCLLVFDLFRYQREEAKIQAWINLESAKAEAQSRKLEVIIKIQCHSCENAEKKWCTIINCIHICISCN
jgi:hypothetical protein